MECVGIMMLNVVANKVDNMMELFELARQSKVYTYINIFKGVPIDMKLLQKSCTDCRELTSICITWSLASFIFVWINLFAFSPASTFLTAITTCTPRKANTRVVSRPIPLDAPAFQIYSFYACFGNTYYNVIHVVVVGIRNANDYFIILI